MPDTIPAIVTIDQPLTATEKDELLKLFASSGFSVLKSIIVTRAIKQQVAAMDWLSKAADPEAVAVTLEYRRLAIQYSAFIDFLDALQKSEEEWHTVKLEPRR